MDRPKDHPKKLVSQPKAEELGAVSREESAQSAAREFASAEEMLREDARQTVVPAAIAQRLQESVAQLPAPPRSWWRRLLGH